MIIASKQTIEKACKGAKLQRGGKCKGRGIMMRKRVGHNKNKFAQKARSMKKGGKSNIHIKKSMEGTFTEWCRRHGFGGVTDACIQAGLKCKDPRIRKKANFARNARKFKH